jgi:cytochrome c oxidase cbb3-type subunit 2
VVARSPIFESLAGLGLFASLMVSWGALVAGPVMQLGGLQQASMIGADTRPYPKARSGLAARGAEVFRANGCVECHTQQVRPASLGSDLERGWGKRRSVARDYIFDYPALPGTVRIGPDLANAGSRQNFDTLLWRLYNPNALARGSIMPSFGFLFEPASAAQTKPAPLPEARALAAYLESLRSDAPLYEAPVEQASSLLKAASNTGGPK